MFSVTSGRDNVIAKIQIKNLCKSQHQAIRRAFYLIGKDLVHDAQQLILKKPKSGRLYRLRRNGRSVLHRASAPGEPPANFTGSLRKSIDFDVVGMNYLEFGVREKFENRKGVKYGAALERGTTTAGKKHNITIEPRPFLLPTIKKNHKNTQQHFSKQLRRHLEKKR